MSTLQAEPAHILAVTAHILRAVARTLRDTGANLTPDNLDAIAAGLDKEAGR